MHKCNAHFGVLSISSLTSWDVTDVISIDVRTEEDDYLKT
jgi:hypothetical protein